MMVNNSGSSNNKINPGNLTDKTTKFLQVDLTKAE